MSSFDAQYVVLLAQVASTTSGLGFSYPNCTTQPVNAYCEAGVWAGTYFVRESIGAYGPVAADFGPSCASFAESPTEPIESWDRPTASKQVPEGALARGMDCGGEVRVTDAAVRAASRSAFDPLPSWRAEKNSGGGPERKGRPVSRSACGTPLTDSLTSQPFPVPLGTSSDMMC